MRPKRGGDSWGKLHLQSKLFGPGLDTWLSGREREQGCATVQWSPRQTRLVKGWKWCAAQQWREGYSQYPQNEAGKGAMGTPVAVKHIDLLLELHKTLSNREAA